MTDKRLKRPLIWLVVTVVTLITLCLPLQTAEGFNWFTGQEIEEPLTEEDLQKLIEVYNTIQTDYIEEVDKKQLLEGALKGMVQALEDPYSEYLNTDESDSLNETVEGEFTGIGVQFMMENGQVKVVTPIEGTPAAEVGIQPNDVILEADGTELSGMDTNEVVRIIRGEEGTTITLKVQRGASVIDLEINRARIPIITVTGEVAEADPSVGVVKITQFNGTTYDELLEVIEDLRQQHVTSFVFDLRNNPGGLLEQALRICNLFLEDGQMIMHIEEGTGPVYDYPASDKEYGESQVTEPYVALVNKGSASASEIFAAAIQENTDAPVLGNQTFGKGTVQTISNTSELGELKLTSARWLTPNKHWIHGEGVEVDEEIEVHPIYQSLVMQTDEVLNFGMRNEFVASLRAVLNQLDYDVELGDLYDESVVEAVKAFQADHQLDPTGEVTGETAEKINQLAREYIQAHDEQLDAAIERLLELTEQDQAA